MKRREFITLLGGGAAWPGAAHAQQPAMPVIGLINPTSPDSNVDRLRGFRQGLKDTGYVEGENVAIEYRWAENQIDRLPALADDLVRRKVAVIVTTGGPLPARAAKAATATIPIVFATGGDPVAHGLVPKLSGSEGNITGVTFLNAALMPKRLEVIREAVPEARVFAMLVNSDSQSLEADSRDIRQAALSVGAQVHIIYAAGQGDPDSAFTEVLRRQVDAVLVHPDSVLYSHIGDIVRLAARHRVPTIYFSRECLEQGGLMSYGPELRYVIRQAGVYAGRILRGEKPADLPVQQATKFELVIDLKTAKALGITVPATLLARADEVIE
jgi:putative ABC transport system substrate-binding protein